MTIRLKAFAAALVLTLLASPAAARRGPIMLGYLPASTGLDVLPADSVLGRYTHVAIAFANPDATGALTAGGVMACMPGRGGGGTSITVLHAAIAAIHRVGGRALLSTGGGVLPACAGDWTTLLTPATAPAIAGRFVDLAEQVGADGIDVDIEGALLTNLDKSGGYGAFVDALAAALHRRGKLLTCATASYVGGMIPLASVGRFDLVSVMSYDQIGPSWGKAGAEQSTYAASVGDLDLWRSRGVRRDRLLLGLPFYGYGFGRYAPSYGYRDVLAAFGAEAAAGDVIGSRCAGCDYVTQNGPATLTRKAALARHQAAGVMVWQIAQDTPDGKLATAVRGALDGHVD